MLFLVGVEVGWDGRGGVGRRMTDEGALSREVFFNGVFLIIFLYSRGEHRCRRLTLEQAKQGREIQQKKKYGVGAGERRGDKRGFLPLHRNDSRRCLLWRLEEHFFDKLEACWLRLGSVPPSRTVSLLRLSLPTEDKNRTECRLQSSLQPPSPTSPTAGQRRNVSPWIPPIPGSPSNSLLPFDLNFLCFARNFERAFCNLCILPTLPPKSSFHPPPPPPTPLTCNTSFLLLVNVRCARPRQALPHTSVNDA